MTEKTLTNSMTFTTVSDEERSAFPGHFFQDHLFDTKIFNMADNLIKDYKGGYWEYVIGKNVIDGETGMPTPFFRLRTAEPMTPINPFRGEELVVDATLAGMIVTSYAVNLVNEDSQTEHLYELWTQLREAIYSYAEETNQIDQAFCMMD